MSDSRAAVVIDRLPWLEDEPKSVPKSALSGLWRWSVPALAMVAGISFWLGSRTAPSDRFDAPIAELESPPVATMTLPEPHIPVAEEPVSAAAPTVRHGRTVTRRSLPARPTIAPDKRAAASAPARLQYWPARQSAAAAGRMVRIGTFATPAQAKKGWRGVVHIYPGMKPIPAVVVPLRSLRDGRTYYRLQMGTTSQAHSEILCQRMRIIGQSCVVVGLGKGPA